MMQTAFVGIEVNRVLEGQISFPMVVRYPETELDDLDVIGRTLIDSPSGAKVPLNAVADDSARTVAPTSSGARRCQRKIVVQCNVAGRDLRGVVNEIRAAVAEKVTLPQGYRVEYGGQFESEAEASRSC